MMKATRLFAVILCVVMLLSIVACNKDSGGSSNGSTASQTDSSDNSNSGNTNSGGSSNSGDSTVSGGGITDSGGGSQSSVDSDRVLNIAVSQDSGTLHPFGVSGSGGFPSVLGTCMEGLFYLTEDGDHAWLLATGIDVISELQSTIHIREGVRFSNGNPLTAEDVMFTMELNAADPRSFLNVKGIDIEKTSVTGEYTIDLWFTEFNAAQEPGFSEMSIMDKESYDAVKMGHNPIGTGPYVITEHVVNSHVIAEARDDYWGDPPGTKKIVFKVIDEESQRINALEVGDVDIASISLKDAEFVESLGYVAQNIRSAVPITVNFNMTEGSVMGSKEARWAVCHAIDRQAIVDIVYYGRSHILNWPSSENLSDFEPRFLNQHETYSVGYNPDRAKELAEQSGLTGKTVRLITNGSADWITISEIIQSNLEAIGVNAEIINYDQATYFSIIMDESNFDLAVFNPTAGSRMAVDIFGMYLTFVPQGWKGPERDLYGQLSLKALATPDPATRGDMIAEYMEIFLDNCPWFGLCEGLSMRAVSSDLQGFVYTLSGGFRLSRLYFTS